MGMGRRGASALSLRDFMRPKDFRKSMDLLVGSVGVVVEARELEREEKVATNVGVVRQAGARLAAEAGGVSNESRNRNRKARRKEEEEVRGEQHIPMAACPDQARRVTPNDHHHDHHHQYHDDDQRHRHPAHLRHMTTTTTKTTLHRAGHKPDRNGLWPCDLVTPSRNAMLLLALAIHLLIGFAPIATEAVDCFKCSSRNGSNPACEDPFHNLNTTRVNSPILPDPQPSVIYHTPCYAGKKGREGLFPASACIKLTGVFDTTGETLVVRHCALDSGTLTQDTELARMSHCGKFQFEGDLLRGCVLACPEDACNSAQGLADSIERHRWLIMWSLVWLALGILVSNPQR